MFSRLLIVVAVVAAAFFAFQYFTGKMGGGNSASTETERNENRPAPYTPAPNEGDNTNADNNATGENRTTTDKTSNSVSGFNFTPAAPVNGKLKGVVELGATGFNSFVVRIDNQKNWQLEKAEFGASLVYENMATSADIRDGLKRYIARMLDFGVAPKDIHYVTSSGAAREEGVQKISAELKKMGYVVNPVTAEREGQLALLCVLPEAYKEDAFVVDIGSSNTKISWMEGGKIRSMETYGSKYFQNGTSDEKVYEDVKKLVVQIPQNKRQVGFMIGGAVFDAVKTHRTGKERYTVLKAPTDYSGLKEQKTKSGMNIYRAIQDATGTDTFVFDWDSNFTIGFLLTLPG
jgi:hypothetical protein